MKITNGELSDDITSTYVSKFESLKLLNKIADYKIETIDEIIDLDIENKIIDIKRNINIKLIPKQIAKYINVNIVVRYLQNHTI